ncbi:MAG TPA: AI-2E family transporter [Spirochaetia bacterium]|nr:AI-2E family transporter [Spirochaetia bacterium]
MESSRTANTLLIMIAFFFLVVTLKLGQPVILALLLALLLAYVMDPIMMGLKKLGMHLALAVTFTTALFLGVFFGAGTLIVSNLISFGRRLPLYQIEFVRMVNSLTNEIKKIAGDNINLDFFEEIRKLPIGSIVIQTATTIASNVTLFLLVFLFSVLILIEKYNLPRKIVKVFSAHKHSKIPVILKHVDTSLRKFIGVRTLISLSIGTASGLVLFLFGVEFAIIWGLLTFLLNFVPNIGSAIAMTLPSLFSVIQFPGTPVPLWIFASLAACQFVTGVVLEPKFMGDTLNLSLLVIFLSMFFWGWLWGPVGVILAVPMTTSLKIVLATVPSTSRFTVFLEKPRVRRKRTGTERKK